jgi:hypothetical protein
MVLNVLMYNSTHFAIFLLFVTFFFAMVWHGGGTGGGYNPNDTENHFLTTENAKGYNLLHLNAMYDLCSRVYVDSIVQPGRKENEFKALTDMVDRSDIKEQTLIIADRGYEGYNVFEHINKKSWNYVICVIALLYIIWIMLTIKINHIRTYFYC